MTHNHDGNEIEGVIFKTQKGVWVTYLSPDGGNGLRLQVNYCPWCGEELR